MADSSRSSNSNATPDVPGTNPDVTSQAGGINPSAPTVGTEGWGTTSDEREVLGPHDPAHTRAGQMKGNPGDNQAEMSQKMSEAATSANHPEEKRPRGSKSFRCADAGNPECDWEVSAPTDDEVVERAMEHGRLDHGWADWTEALSDKVRQATKNRPAD